MSDPLRTRITRGLHSPLSSRGPERRRKPSKKRRFSSQEKHTTNALEANTKKSRETVDENPRHKGTIVCFSCEESTVYRHATMRGSHLRAGVDETDAAFSAREPETMSLRSPEAAVQRLSLSSRANVLHGIFTHSKER